MDKFKNSLLAGMGLLILVNMMVLLSLRSGVSQSTTTVTNKKPWQQEFITPSILLSRTGALTTSSVSYTVPTGRVLVVEAANITANLAAPGVQPLNSGSGYTYRVTTTVGGVTSQSWISTAGPWQNANTQQVPLKAYADPGTVVTLTMFYSNNTGGDAMTYSPTVTLVGQLVKPTAL